MHSFLPREKYRSWFPHGFSLLNIKGTQTRLLLEKHVRETFSDAGYKEVTLPSFDYFETFQIATRHAKNNPTFQLRGREDEQLTVSSDLTVQLIKAAANGYLGHLAKSPSQVKDARFSYIQPVFHDRPWGSGGRRAVLQAGVELINYTTKNRIDHVKEILQLAKKCASIKDIKSHILYGDVRVVEKICEKIPTRFRSELSLAFHKKDTAVIRDICIKAKIEKPYKEILTELPLIFGDKNSIEELKKLCKDQPEICSLFDEAKHIEGVTFDFSLVLELTYYTGPVFEAYITEESEKVFTGGVYDSLFGEFSDSRECSACGFALDLSLMIEKLTM